MDEVGLIMYFDEVKPTRLRLNSTVRTNHVSGQLCCYVKCTEEQVGTSSTETTVDEILTCA